ncbi:hypothetical protein, conserved [Trypanosoma brucei gambiense DAL972]|uniref:Uncharacterized protein n=1 Tax=Trypanosoma brucei gambiense (strain MHOM/CI/86/DAL972) TaxID=679716 RepID=C9ZV90_TRYB9|nr:hypothetical protein, conserved [Trypanosoma brucei gambiense DAL972]CBH13328.1 hypothetical protein, conserved [Trypanosoma brucei gambiense DAL972]|eukprot:XP_011775605.1 hypothetical protein, conserved [Trypanosoma brucei gambiense DAL972]
MTTATVKPEIVIAVLSMCGLLTVVVIILLVCSWWSRRKAGAYAGSALYRGFKRRHQFELVCTPGPGAHPAPLEVQLRTSHVDPCDILVDVQYTPPGFLKECNRTAVSPARLLGADEHYGEQYLLYSHPFVFRGPGRYTVNAHTVSPSMRYVGAVHNFCFDVLPGDTPSGSGDTEMEASCQHADDFFRHDFSTQRDVATKCSITPIRHPLPPRIIPNEGEVTTFTPIIITTNNESTTADQIRYSVDGRYPSLLYTGPFTLSVPPFSNACNGSSVPVVVRAVAVSGSDTGLTSEVVTANFTVYRAGHSFFDPQVPAPVARVHAVYAKLYFDESRRPPNTNILYQLVYVSEARQKPKFSRRRGFVYTGAFVPLREDVAFIYAWTFVGDGNGDGTGVNVDELNGGGRRHIRSSAAVYDCRRGTSWNREARDEGGLHPHNNDRTHRGDLSPPVICVSCSEMEVFFEDPPAGGVVCYTLDRTEPAAPGGATAPEQAVRVGLGTGAQQLARSGPGPNFSTYVYKSNQPIHVTLLQTEQVFVTARTFIPVADGAAGDAVTCYRFSDRFFRGFAIQ